MPQEDWIGLRALDEAGRLTFETCPGGHMHISLDWFHEHVTLKYLAPEGVRRQAQAQATLTVSRR